MGLLCPGLDYNGAGLDYMRVGFIFIGMIRLMDLLREVDSPAFDRIDALPKGKIFDDAKNIEGVFKRSSHTWTEVVSTFERNRESGELTVVNLKDVRITQPNVQSNRVKQKVNKLINNEGSPINVVRFEDGELAVFDGHHRLTAHWALGHKRIRVNLVST